MFVMLPLRFFGGTFFKETININIENFICGHWGQVSFLELIKLGEKNIFTFEIYIFLKDIITFKLKNKKNAFADY